MQWSADKNGGFSTADTSRLFRQPISSGPWRYKKVNVERSQLSRHSLLHRVRHMVNIRAELHEICQAPWKIIPLKQEAVFAILYRGEQRDVLALANFSEKPVKAALKDIADGYWEACLADKGYDDTLRGGKAVPLLLNGYGYRWFSRRRD